MTGPPYPPAVSGAGGIGTFAIGITPIGSVSDQFDMWSTMISQYANSPAIVAIIESFNDAVDQTQNIENFYDLVWNVLTAQGYGLDVWGRIIGVTRAVSIPGTDTYLGFQEAGSWTGFGQGQFYSGGAFSDNYVLNDAEFRVLILAKAAGNISDGSIPAVNQILLSLFPNRGVCYVADNLDMTLTYTFLFALTPIELAIIGQANVLPTPAGVSVSISHP